ncbi:MAG: pantoate--beta-alanine ligase [Hyphomicrobiaceae bacterium]|nr:pantoate--beta-alanine ligase [Hyphomicrobiaceae bacterium]
MPRRPNRLEETQLAHDRVPHVRTVADLRAAVRAWRSNGETVALVPTMGALHEGHLSLARHGKSRCTRVVASIFVNPTQFAPTEDFSSYPRTFDDDLAKLAAVDCDLVWAPTADVMYPNGFATMIVPEGAAEGLETDFRPHFFRGVATVCCKLFTQVGADIAVFGEKDYQQLRVVTQMARDLDLPIEIVGRPTVRERDGLAMSSRNAYLSDDERQIAVAMHKALDNVASAVRAGGDIEAICAAQSQTLLDAGFRSVDYLTVRDADTLKPTITGARPETLRALAAAWLGKTRLIDNIACA